LFALNDAANFSITAVQKGREEVLQQSCSKS